MPIRRLTHRVHPAQAGQRLDLVTHEWLEAALGRRLSKSTIRRLIMAGVVRVGGKPTVRAGAGLEAGTRLEASIDERRLPPVEGEMPGRVGVLFEDQWLIAVAKPPGLQVHASADAALADLFTLVRRQLATGARTPSPYLGLHHRLDRDTSGVVLFAKAQQANAALGAQFAGREVEKVYHAITARPAAPVASAWTVENALAPVGKGRAARMAAVTAGGVQATTMFSVVRRLPSALLIEATPHTGRKHQIRAHLAGEGLPIAGDVRYGGPARLGTLGVGRTMLHARRLALRHPVTGARLEIECDYPEDFRDLLARLDSATRSR